MDSKHKKLVAIMGNRNLDSLQKSQMLLDELEGESANPDAYGNAVRFILESYGLAPRHEEKVDGPELDAELVEQVRKRVKDRVDHELKGWFEIHVARPVEQSIVAICVFLGEFTDPLEKTVVFEKILSSSYIPIPVNFFARHIDEEDRDELVLREHADIYIQLRQLLNLKVGPTSRGSLIWDFMAPLKDNPHAQSVIMGAFIEELLLRLRKKMQTKTEGPTPSSNVFSFPLDMQGDNIEDMMKKMRQMLPPEVMDQLRKFFSPGEDDDSQPWKKDPSDPEN